VRRRDLVGVGFLFALSGAAALVYQVVWQRLLVLVTGVGLYSVALIVSVLMFGLGLDSHLGGNFSRRLTPLQALRAFAAVELAVALFALASPTLYYDVIYLRGQAFTGHPVAGVLVHFIALLPPTSLMGMSLPLLVRATVRETRDAETTIALLYGLNVVGGVLAPGWHPGC
jgi:spermidine synthase